VPTMSVKINLEGAMVDVASRFLLNLPLEELKNSDRVFFQLEQAYWFYEDNYAGTSPALVHFSKLDAFALVFFEKTEILNTGDSNYLQMLNTFKAYKHSIPVYGGILLNKECDKVLLVRGWNSKAFSFPRGKINEKEDEVDCARREIHEECGYEVPAGMFTKHNCFKKVSISGQSVTMFIGVGVPEGVKFETKTRKEISEIKWFPLSELIRDPKGEKKGSAKFWDVAQFIGPLVAWIRENYKGSAFAKNHGKKTILQRDVPGKGGASDRRSLTEPKTRPVKSLEDEVNNATFSLDDGGGSKGWSVEQMFKANEKLLGKTFVYDGNPHTFGDAKVAAVPMSNNTNGGDLPRSTSAPTKHKRKGKGLSPDKGGSSASIHSKKNDHRKRGDSAGKRGPSLAPEDNTETFGGVESTKSGGWSIDDMFKANEVLLGKKFTYDGNPHTFGDTNGHGRSAAHVVGRGVPSYASPLPAPIMVAAKSNSAPEEADNPGAFKFNTDEIFDALC
jgi:ADP-ribose pyrophosphatase YjhB (NUDIX family)